MKPVFINILKILGNIILSAVVTLAVVLAIRKDLRDIPAVKEKARFEALNHLSLTPLDHLVALNRGIEEANADKLRRSVYFFKRVAEFLPNRPDAHELMGFCYFHLGEFEAARKSYEKALAINPDFFWTSYNLAAIYLKFGKREEATRSISRALGSNTQSSFAYMMDARSLYALILRKTDVKPEEFIADLKSGYAQGRIFLEGAASGTMTPRMF